MGNPLFCPFPDDAPREVVEKVVVGGQGRTIIKKKQGEVRKEDQGAPTPYPLAMPLER